MASLLLAIIYISFISLGLPDALLGSVWPILYPELNVPVSYSGILFMIIACGTILSSLLSDRLTRRLGTGRITAISVGMTALALFGFSWSHSFVSLCLWAIPYGLGAGSVDAALNNYAALNFKSRHMSWLHCMWGVGASLGPYLMSHAILRTNLWNSGYRAIALLQVALTAVLLFSLPLWKKEKNNEETSSKPLSMKQILSLPGAKEVMLAFFCYCALESTTGLWASSYLVLHKGIPEVTASAFASLFYLGITGGRAINGFLTFRFHDTQLIHMGQALIAAGIACLFLPLPDGFALAGFVLIGLGCAPIYPCIIHSTPEHFGKENSQAIVGVQMASAYVGTMVMPPLFGLLAEHFIFLLPLYLLIILAVQFILYNRLVKITSRKENNDVR